MSLIDEKRQEIATIFYRKHIEPLATNLKEQNRSYFPKGKDASTRSYFTKPKPGIFGDEEFELKVCDSPEGFLSYLAELWQHENDESILTLLEPLKELMSSYDVQTEGVSELSQFIYTLF